MMYIPKDYDPPEPIQVQRGQQERKRKAIANKLHQQIVRREYTVNNLLVSAMIDWYETGDELTQTIVLDQIIKLMDMLGERADRKDINRNFGPISALELLGVALAVDHGWLGYGSQAAANGYKFSSSKSR
jgi:hypothetical protein